MSHPIPLGRPSTGRNLGMVQGTCRCLVLKTNLGPVIHKSLVYQCLETRLCTFHQSGRTSLYPEKNIHIKGHDHQWRPLNQKWQALLCEWLFQKWPWKLQIGNTALLFLPVLNWAGGLATVTVFRTLSILRPCSEKHLYLAIVTGGSVFSSA